MKVSESAAKAWSDALAYKQRVATLEAAARLLAGSPVTPAAGRVKPTKPNA